MAATWEQLSGWQGGGCLAGRAGAPPSTAQAATPREVGSWTPGGGQAEAPSEALGSSPREPRPGDPGDPVASPARRWGLGGTKAVDACPAQRAAGSQEEAEATGAAVRGPRGDAVTQRAQWAQGRARAQRTPLRGGRRPFLPDGTWVEAGGRRGHVNGSARQVSALLLGPGALRSPGLWSVSGSLGRGAGLPAPQQGLGARAAGEAWALHLGRAGPVRFHQGPWSGKRTHPVWRPRVPAASLRVAGVASVP